MRKAQGDGVPPQQVTDHLKEHPHHIEEYMLEIRRGKALAMIVESATVTDSNGSVINSKGIVRRSRRHLGATPTGERLRTEPGRLIGGDRRVG